MVAGCEWHYLLTVVQARNDDDALGLYDHCGAEIPLLAGIISLGLDVLLR